jgi:hypothetical protein
LKEGHIMAIAGYNSQVLIASLPSVAFTNEATSSSDLTTFTITTAAHRYFDKSVAVVTQAQYDETQTVTITGSPTGGTFTLTFGGNTTTGIAYNAAASVVQTALQALASVGAGNALVTGSAGGPYTVEFAGTLAKASQSLITASGASLTGGSSPSVAIARVKAGATWATITTGFTLYKANARITFAAAQPTGTQVRFASGNYFPYSTLAEASTCEFDGKMDMAESTVFGSSGAKTYIPTLLSGPLKYSSYWISNVRSASLIARDYLIISFQTSTGNRYEGFCYASDCNIKVDIKALVGQDLVFQLTDEFFNA